MIAAPRIAVPTLPFKCPISCNASTVILTEVAVRITPIKIDSMILFPYITDKTAPMISGINTPHNAMTNAGIPLFFNSSISVSRPA